VLLLEGLAAYYALPLQNPAFDAAVIEGLASFVRDHQASLTGSIGCECAPLEMLECLQAALVCRPACGGSVAGVMSAVLRGCGAITSPSRKLRCCMCSMHGASVQDTLLKGTSECPVLKSCPIPQRTTDALWQ
jgi:hypothetical protein